MQDWQSWERKNGILQKDKEEIKEHLMFPLLKLLVEKCHLATNHPNDPTQERPYSLSSKAIDEDIKAFAKLLKIEKCHYKADPEVDSLMVNAIEVLRFHLIELEKVDELTESFTKRYVSRLLGKLPIDL